MNPLFGFCCVCISLTVAVTVSFEFVVVLLLAHCEGGLFTFFLFDMPIPDISVF